VEARITSVPEPQDTRAIETALQGRAQGHRFAFAVLDDASGRCWAHQLPRHPAGRAPRGDRLHLVPQSVQRTHVNTTAKLLMMGHAFDTLGCHVVGWRTDNFNFASQRAIERLGAKKDGVIRGHALRRDGTIRDTVMYSMRSGEWPEARAQLLYLLQRHAQADGRWRHFHADRLFYTLRAAKLPVSVKEYLTLLEALEAGVVGPARGRWSLDDFYYLARTTLVKDESTTTSSTAPSPPTSRAWRCWPTSPRNPAGLAAQVLERELSPEEKAKIEKWAGTS
jgi:RimJ/RimL family protein N-acetyltransferase